MLLADFHDDVGEHLDETAVAVPRPARVLRLLGKRLDDRLVEAEVEDRIHHARHRGARTRTDRDEERILEVAELLAGRLLELHDVFEDLLLDVVADLPAVVVIARARFGRNGEALRNGEPETGHFSEVRALAAEEFAHVGVAFGLPVAEEINVLLFFHLSILITVTRKLLSV